MGSTTYHVHLRVRAALRDYSRQELASMFRSTKTGKNLSAAEAKEVLYDHLAQGHEVIPLGPVCAGFDWTGRGCPGHQEGAA